MRAALNVRSAKRQVAAPVLLTITLSVKEISALVACVFRIVNNRRARCVNCCKCPQSHLCSFCPSLLSLHPHCRTIKIVIKLQPEVIAVMMELCAVCAHSDPGHTILR